MIFRSVSSFKCRFCFIKWVEVSLDLSTYVFSCFDYLLLHVLEFLLSSLGGRVCDVRADLSSLVSLKFLFGCVNQHFSFSLVCSFLPIATMSVQ